MPDQDKPDKTGKFLGVPFDWRPPTKARLKERLWNPNDRRIMTPKQFGWGWSINFYEIAARLHLKKRPMD